MKDLLKSEDEVASSKDVNNTNSHTSILHSSAMRGLILHRFDQLPQLHQTVLKAGSVIGNVFTLDLLHDLLPLSLRRDLT